MYVSNRGMAGCTVCLNDVVWQGVGWDVGYVSPNNLLCIKFILNFEYFKGSGYDKERIG
jgi:hypothetical protein